jgi:hypothetical protein
VNLILAGKLSYDPFVSAPFTDPIWLKKELEAADSDELIDTLATFYRRLPRAAGGTHTPFGNALDEALDALAQTSELNRLRVERIRRST